MDTLLEIKFYYYLRNETKVIYPYIRIEGEDTVYRFSAIEIHGGKFRRFPRLYKPELLSILDIKFFKKEFPEFNSVKKGIVGWKIEKTKFLRCLVKNSLTGRLVRDLEKI